MTKQQLITAITAFDPNADLTGLTKAELTNLYAVAMTSSAPTLEQQAQFDADRDEEARINAEICRDQNLADAEPAPTTDSTDDRTADAPDLLDMAKAASVKPTKAPAKPKTVHAQSPSTNLPLCNVAGGLVSSDEALITCKICLAKIHGIKPVNAISDEVKAARKQFASFKARVGYMMYMDRPANAMAINNVQWSMHYTNSAGITYSASGRDAYCGLTDSEGGSEDIWVKSALDDAIAKLGWEA